MYFCTLHGCRTLSVCVRGGRSLLSVPVALVQCREKRYADAYAADGRRVVYVGVNYDPAARTVDAVRTEVAVTNGSGL